MKAATPGEGRQAGEAREEGRAAAAEPKKLPPPLAPSTLDKLRERLVEERDRHLGQAELLQAEAEVLASEREQGDTQFDEESGEGDTVSVERERDLALSATARQTVDDIERGAGTDGRRHVRAVRELRRSHPGHAARGDPLDRTVREVQGPWGTAPVAALQRRRRGRLLRIALVVAAIVAVDQLTKAWVVATLLRRPAPHHRRHGACSLSRATLVARSDGSRA